MNNKIKIAIISAILLLSVVVVAWLVGQKKAEREAAETLPAMQNQKQETQQEMNENQKQTQELDALFEANKEEASVKNDEEQLKELDEMAKNAPQNTKSDEEQLKELDELFQAQQK